MHSFLDWVLILAGSLCIKPGMSVFFSDCGLSVSASSQVVLHCLKRWLWEKQRSLYSKVSGLLKHWFMVLSHFCHGSMSTGDISECLLHSVFQQTHFVQFFFSFVLFSVKVKWSFTEALFAMLMLWVFFIYFRDVYFLWYVGIGKFLERQTCLLQRVMKYSRWMNESQTLGHTVQWVRPDSRRQRGCTCFRSGWRSAGSS